MNLNVSPCNIRKMAENYYRNSDYFCSEAVVKAIKEKFELSIADDVIAMASGFPRGIGGTGCICGAVAGGVMALGMFFGRTKAKDEKVNKVIALAKELHDIFIKEHGTLCRNVLIEGMKVGSPKHVIQCMTFTGEVAEETAKIILRELK